MNGNDQTRVGMGHARSADSRREGTVPFGNRA